MEGRERSAKLGGVEGAGRLWERVEQTFQAEERLRESSLRQEIGLVFSRN